MDALQQPIIIDKVFEFLGLLDIEQCQYVCRAWRESALRQFRQCPAIDGCRVILESQLWRVDSNSLVLGKKAKQQKRLLLIENRKMNGIESKTFPDLVDDFVYYWYFLRTRNLFRLPKFQIDDAVRKFLTTGVRCLPGFSLIRYDEDFAHPVEGMIFSHPTLLIKYSHGHVYDSLRGLRTSKKGIKKFPSSTSEMKIFWKLFQDNSLAFSTFESLHISRSIPGLKIIITDWSDPQSPRPNVNDSEFPIKFMLYLGTGSAEFSNELEEIKKLLGESNFKSLQGFITHDYDHWGVYHRIFIVNPGETKPKLVPEVSIAFAGKKVNFATHVTRSELDPKKSLEDFKLNLEFPTDVDRVIGFFSNGCAQILCPGILNEVFPYLRLIKLRHYKVVGYEDQGYYHAVLHIVWF